MVKNKITIPKGWAVKRLGDFGTCIRGVSYSPGDLMATQNSSSLPLLRSNNIKNDTLDFSDVQIVTKNKIDDKQILRKGDVFICMSNGSRSLVGKNVYIKDDINSTIGAFCSLYRVQDTDQFSANYVGQLFKTQVYFDQIKNELAGTSINNLKNSTIENLEFLFPQKKEQEKIAEILSALDERIGKMGLVIKKTEVLKKGLMSDLLSGKVRV